MQCECLFNWFAKVAISRTLKNRVPGGWRGNPFPKIAESVDSRPNLLLRLTAASTDQHGGKIRNREFNLGVGFDLKRLCC